LKSQEAVAELAALGERPEGKAALLASEGVAHVAHPSLSEMD
jgi:hypothetical protein